MTHGSTSSVTGDGHHASVVRARRRKAAGVGSGGEERAAAPSSPDELEPTSAEKTRLRCQWAQLIRWIYEADPLLCECGGRMRILSFLTHPPVVEKILAHLERKGPGSQRGPPSTDEGQQLAS